MSFARLSLRWRILATALATVSLVWVVATSYAYVDARHEIEELLDGYLVQTASLLVARLAGEPAEIDVEHAPQLHRYARHLAFQVWADGKLRLHSANAPDGRMSEVDGFADVRIDGARWRVFSSDGGPGVVVQVGERGKERDELAGDLARNLLAPLAVALPLLALLLWPAVGLGLRPLRRIGEEVQRRDPRNLAPLDAAPMPDEVAPLASSLNALFARVGESIEQERRFTADAAHELRTPIAALRAQAQVALGATADDERRRALSGVVAGCDRGARLVEQLLTLARLDPLGLPRPLADVDLASLVRTGVADIAPDAVAKGTDVEVDAPVRAGVRGAPELLSILLRNLLDNAVRHSPAGSTVRVSVRAAPAGTVLEVVDDGPGVAADVLSRLGDRFFRQAGTREPGSGLGLSIVRRIAQLHAASVGYATNPAGRGLAVTVRFPALPVPAALPERHARRVTRPA